MKKILLTLVLCCVATFSNAYSIADYKTSIEKGGDAKNYMEMYVIGFGRGLQWSTSFNRYKEAPEIFCAPKNLTVTGDLILSILNNGLTKSTYKETEALELFIIREFERVFPCK